MTRLDDMFTDSESLPGDSITQEIAEFAPKAPVIRSEIRDENPDLKADNEFVRQTLISLAEKAQQGVEIALGKLASGNFRASDVEAFSSIIRAAGETAQSVMEIQERDTRQAVTQIATQGGNVYLTTHEIISALEDNEKKKD